MFKHPPRLGFPAFERDIEPNQLVVKLDPSTGIRLIVEAHRADGPGAIELDMEFAAEGGEGPTPYEVLLHAALVGDEHALHPPGRGRGAMAGDAAAARRTTTGAPVCARIVGPRRSRTSSSPASAAGTGRGSPHERLREREGGRPAERGGAVAVPADRRLRVPVELPHGRAGGGRRRDRLALRAGVRLRERLRQPARPPGGVLPARAVRHQPPRPAQLRAWNQRARDGLEDADRLDRGARRADDGAARARGRDHAAHAAAGRRRRRPHAGAHGRVHRRPGRDRAGL